MSAPHNNVALLCLIVGIVLQSSLPATAQPRVTRLSSDQIEYVTHDRGAMQAAATIGNTTLAVWANSAFGPDSAVISRLHMQIIRDGEPVGTPTTLTDTAARPHTAMAVAALADRFLVIWNDERKEAPELYGRIVGRDGMATGPVISLSPGKLRANGEAWIAGGAGRYGLYWNDSRDSAVALYRLFLDVEGERLEKDSETQVRGGAAVGILRYAAPTVALARMETGPHAMIDSTGDIATFNIPPEYLNGTFQLGADGTLAVFRNDSLLIYENPSSTSLLQAGAFEFTEEYQTNLAFLGIDSLGRYVLLIPWMDVVGSLPPAFQCRIERFTIVKGALSEPEEITRGWGGGWVRSFANAGSRLHQFDNGAGAIEVRCHISNDVPTNGKRELDSWFKVQYRFDREGRLTRDCGTTYNEASSKDALKNESLCTQPGEFILRTEGDSTIALQIRHVNGEVTVVESKAVHSSNVVDREPALFTSHDSLFVVWKIDVGEPAYQIHHWDRKAQQVRPVDRIVPQSTYRYSSRNGNTTRTWGGASYLHTGTAVGISNTVSREATYWDYPGVVDRQGNAWFGIATPVGWKTLISFSEWVIDTNAWRVGTMAWDPNTGEVIAGTYGRRPGVYGIRHDSLVWSAGLPWDRAADYQVVPIAEQEFFTIRDDTIHLFQNGELQWLRSVECPACTTTYHRLLGTSILAVSNNLSDTQSVRLTIYDRWGTVVAQRIVAAERGIRGWSVVPHPTVETILLLIGGADGVAAAGLDYQLQTFPEKTPGTAVKSRMLVPTAGLPYGPRGIVIGDSLAVVWEESNGLASDIFGTFLSYREAVELTEPQPDPISDNENDDDSDETPDITPGLPDEENPDHILALRSVAPNPAVDHVTIRFLLRSSGPVDISLYDILGRCISRESGILPEGEHERRLGPLPDGGAYLLQIRSGEERFDVPVAAVGN